mgnify:CR=1 FL=1
MDEIIKDIERCMKLQYGDKQHQITRGDNYNKFYLLILFEGVSLTFAHNMVLFVHLCNNMLHI